MTALDQALIKAYVRRGAGSETGATEAKVPAVPLSQALAELAGTRSTSMSIDSLLDDSPVSATSPAARAAVQPVETPVAKNVFQGPARTAATPRHPSGSEISSSPMPKGRNISPLPTVADFLHVPPTRAASIHTESAGPILSMGSIDATGHADRDERDEAPPASTREVARPQGNTYRADPAVSDSPQYPEVGHAVPPPHLAAPLEEPQPEPDATQWRPMLQVDHYVWPETWSRLQTIAIRQMDQLTEGLMAIVRDGSKVLGFGSCSSGEGVTTLALAAGRRLALQGLRVVLVDANLANPKVAASLGLLPQVGWEETLAGRMPLEEVLIESLADQLAVLPVHEPTDNPSDAATDESRVTESLDTLAMHYDAVLIDLGPLESPATAGGLLGRGIRQRLDAVVLVHNVRSTTPDRLADLQNNLAMADIAHAGTIQNFVAR